MLTRLDDDERLFIEYIKTLIKKEIVYVYDIGAASGAWTDTLKLFLFDRGVRAFLFEPNIYNLSVLDSKYGDDPTIQIIPTAVSNDASFRRINYFNNPEHTSFVRDGGLLRITPTTTLDRFVAEIREPVDIVKIDVEGEESNVLAGAKKTLKEFEPIVQFEYGGAWVDAGKSLNQVFKTLENYGYQLFESNDFVLSHAEVKEDGVMQNYLAVPRRLL